MPTGTRHKRLQTFSVHGEAEDHGKGAFSDCAALLARAALALITVSGALTLHFIRPPLGRRPRGAAIHLPGRPETGAGLIKCEEA